MKTYEYTIEPAGCVVIVKTKTTRMKYWKTIAVVSTGNQDAVERAIWRHKMENKHGNPPPPQGLVDIMSLIRLADEYWTACEAKEGASK